MKLSIIIPVYNVESYLRECLDSIISQDFDETEIICIEDCSTDSSLQILCEYVKKDNRVKIIQHPVNKGLSAARNTGIQAAVGEYIQFVDSDDILVADACNRLYVYAKEKDADIVYFNMKFLNDEKNNLVRKKQMNKEYPGVYTGIELFCMFQENGPPKPEAWRQIIRREYLIKNNLFFHEGIIHEDLLFSFMAAMRAERACDLNLELYIYRQRTGSISWGQKEKSASSLLVCLINICSYWLEHPFTAYEDECIAKYIRGIYTSYLHYKCYQTDGVYYGNDKEILLQKILGGNYFEHLKFKESDIERLRTSDFNIIYGAGKIASETLTILNAENIKVHLIVVTDKKNNVKLMNGIDVVGIDELSVDKDAIFVIGTEKKYHDEIDLSLQNRNYSNIIIPTISEKEMIS